MQVIDVDKMDNENFSGEEKAHEQTDIVPEDVHTW